MPAAKKSSTAVAKPTYAVMVAESIKALKDRTGSSVPAISKHVQAKYGIDINKPALVKAIKKGVEAGDFIQIKASYKLNKKTPAPAAKPKKTVEKKKPAPKASTRKAPAARKAASTKPKKTITKKTTTSKRSTTTTTKKVSTKKTAPRKATTTKRKASKK